MSIPGASVLKRVSSTQFLRGVAIIAGGSAIAQAIPFLLMPVLSRLYAPSDMGQFALYFSFFSVFANATTLGYSQAIVSADDEAEAGYLTVLSAVIVFPAGLAFAALLAVFIDQSWFGFESLPLTATPFMFLSLAFTGLYLTMRYWLIREGNFAVASKATVMQSIGRMATQIVVGLVRPFWGGLVAGEVAGRASGLRAMWKASSGRISEATRPLKSEMLRQTAHKYRKFPLLSTPSNLLDSLGAMLPVPLIARSFGIDAAGQYSIASQSLLVPLSLVSSSVADVFHNRIARYARETPHRARRFFFVVTGTLLLLGAAPMMVVMLFGDVIWPFVFGEQWTLAGTLVAAIAPWALARFVVSPVSRVVFVYQGQELKLVYDVLSVGAVVLVFVLADRADMSLTDSLRTLAVAQVAIYSVYFLLLVRVINRSSSTSSG
jgi:O-antigen/teichoic acid export membrane protein